MLTRVVISIHGIRTRGVWQKQLVPILARAGFIPYVLDYGNFTALSLLRRSQREKKIDWLLGEYNRIVQESGDRRPSIIAHSFGTFQVAALIERYPDVKFDNVILAASIVRKDFDWTAVLEQGRVNFVENDYGGRDLWPRIAAKVVRGAGASGTVGFDCRNDLLNQRVFSHYTHSNYFHYSHFKQNWIPTLALNKRRLVEILKVAAETVSGDLMLPYEKVRAYVLLPDTTADNRLHVLPGLHVNMNDEADLKRAISTNLGAMSTSAQATAFNTRQAVVASYVVKKNDSAPKAPEAVEETSEPAKLKPPEANGTAPRLNWIVSIPIVSTTNAVLGVFNVDGLSGVESERLGALANKLVPFAQAIRPSLETVAAM